MLKPKFKPWMLLIPLLLLLGPTSLIPFVYAIYMSLYRYVVTSPAPVVFIGLGNYVKLFYDDMFINALWRGLIFAISCITLEVALGFGLALLLWDIPSKLGSFLRVMLCIPLAAPPIVIGTMWKLMLNPDVGPVPYFLRHLNIDFNIGESELDAFLATLFMDAWHWTPLVTFILLAGLLAIPKGLLEVAEVSGATFMQKLRHVIVPLISQQFLIASLIRFMDALRIFDEVWMLTCGGPGISTQYLCIYIYRLVLTQWDLGYGSALSIVTLYIIIGFSMLLFNLLLKGGGEE